MAPSSDAARWLHLYGDALHRFALMRVRDAATAEDLVQETLIAAMKAREAFRGEAEDKTWLIGILKNKVIDHLRKAAREVAWDPDKFERDGIAEGSFDAGGNWQVRIADWSAPEQDLERTQFWKVLQACVDALPERMARLFVLREVDGMSAEEIRELVGVSSVNNVWTMLSRARMRMRECLQGHWFGREQAG
jgi:RNA polymerase sigma-70 factor (ECF subfamily)